MNNRKHYVASFALPRGQAGRAYITLEIDGQTFVVAEQDFREAIEPYIADVLDIGEGMEDIES